MRLLLVQILLLLIPGDPARGEIWAVNPYLTINWRDWSLLAEVIGGRVVKGATDGVTDANPIGLNFIPTYMWNDSLEFVFRASYIDTNKRGLRISTVVPCAPDTTDLAIGDSNDFFGRFILPAGDLYNKANAWYAGINYYMANRAVKFSAGYEFIRFKDRQSGLFKTIRLQGDQPSGLGVFAALDPNGFHMPSPPDQFSPLGTVLLHKNEKTYVHTFRARLQLVF